LLNTICVNEEDRAILITVFVLMHTTI